MDCRRFSVDANVLGLELGEIDAGDGLAVDDEKKAVACEQVGKDGAGFGAFDDGVDGVDDGFQAVKPLDALNDSGNRGVEDSGAACDGGGDAGHDAIGGVADEDDRAAAPRTSERRKRARCRRSHDPSSIGWSCWFDAN